MNTKALAFMCRKLDQQVGMHSEAMGTWAIAILRLDYPLFKSINKQSSWNYLQIEYWENDFFKMRNKLSSIQTIQRIGEGFLQL
jgi:hypothetical protein